MFTQAQLRKTSEILYHTVTSKDVKLRYGLSKRAEIMAALKRGEKVGGYRVQFILRARNAIVDTLMEVGQEFNTANPHDLVSLQDFGDVLTTTLKQLHTVADKKAEEK
jgi:hypothetical protein